MNLEARVERLFKRFGRLKDDKARNKLYVFLICLLISIFIWFLIALSNESVTALVYPVKFKNAPADMVLVNTPDSVLTFRISSGGFELLTLKYLSRKKPIEIDLANLVMENQDGYFTANYNIATLSAEILRSYSFKEELVSISPEILYFRFEPLAGKMVPVISDLNLVFDKQFRLTDSIVFSPQEVKIIGPKHIIENIDYIRTENKLFSEISGPLSARCGLVKPIQNEQLVVIPDHVDFLLNAEKYTESVISLPVFSESENINVKTFPDRVQVTYLVSLDNFNRVEADMFKAVIEVPENTDKPSRLKVELINKPSFIQVTRIDPSDVEYLVLKK